MRLVVVVFSLLCAITACCGKGGDGASGKNGSGVGFAFSGAGGRIAQHCALMEALVKGLNPDGTKIRPSFLSGASSGSISAVVLNAILETEEKGLPNGVTWDFYKAALFNMTNDDVYNVSPSGIARIFTHNILEGYVLDTTNLRNYLQQYADRMKYKILGDLFIPTCLSVVNQTSGDTVRLCSDNPEHQNLDIMEVIMASAAVPVAFPPIVIDGLDNAIWIDGGTGIDTIPVYSLLQRPQCTEVYIICYASALTSGGANDLPFPIDDILVLKNALATLNDMRVDLFAGAIDMAADSAVHSFSYIPTLNQTFSTLDFDHEKLEYDLTMQWAMANNPHSLN